MKLIQDEFLMGLVSSIKQRAESFLDRNEDLTAEDLEMQLRFWFSRRYNIPMFGETLSDYTLKDMLFEFYLHTHAERDKKETSEETINENREELASLFESEFSDEEHKFMDQAFGSWDFSEEGQ